MQSKKFVIRFNLVHTFDDLNSCIDFLTDIDENEIVYLVISEPFEEEFLSLLDSFMQIK